MIRLSDETEVLARRLAEAHHVTAEDAVRQALEARARATGLLPEPQTASAADRRAELARIVREIAALPVLDTRSPQQIMDDLNEA
jgi:antitoxin VapB